VLTLILLGKLEEARQILATNWRLNAPPHANTTPRIAFLRHVIALLEADGPGATVSAPSAVADRRYNSAPTAVTDRRYSSVFLGQIKTLLTGPELPVTGDVAVPWDIAYFIEFMKDRIQKPEAGSQNVQFLSALVAALNDRTQLPGLDAYPEWRDQPAVPLDRAWPD